MVGIEWILLLCPVGKNLNKLPARQPWAKAHFKALEHTLSGDTGSDRRRRVVHHQPAGDVHLHYLVATVKFPGERTAGLRIAEKQALVVRKVVRCPRLAKLLQIA